MLKITKNTYPENGIGKHKIGTLCKWLKSNSGHLELRKCNDKGYIFSPYFEKHSDGYTYDVNSILGLGQVYAQNGNLLSGKKEPVKIGLVAKFIKNGWFLEVSNCC